MAQFRQSGQHLCNSSNGGEPHISIGIRSSSTSSSSSSQQKPGRSRRSARSEKLRGLSFTSLLVVLSLVLLVTLLTYLFLSLDPKDTDTNKPLLGEDDDDDTKNDSDFLTNVTRISSSKMLKFGKGSVSHGGDSRYWDRDDRRRDEDYSEDDSVEHTRGLVEESHSSDGEKTAGENGTERRVHPDVPSLSKGLDRRGVGFYNEDGRKELKRYEAVYEASLKNASHSGGNGNGDQVLSDDDDEIDEYDDSIDLLDTLALEDGNHDHHQGKSRTGGGGAKSSNSLYSGSKDQKLAKGTKDSSHGGARLSKVKPELKRKPKRRSSCEMKFVNATQLVEPFQGGKFTRFALQYVDKEENSNEQEQWEPRFAGHQSLQEREESFLVNDKTIHCGFVKGPEGSSSTGFDLTEDDTNYISKCHIAVVSCIFGNSDRLRSPVTKMVSRSSRKNVCFVMFVDEITLATLSSENQMPDREGYIGLWKVVVVKNLPYTDMRRVGKIPKLLPHRLFPSARYSIWLDSKLRFQVDPLSVLEYFLWRKGYEYAISNHYDRHCVWEEVAQNKRLNKYNHTVIDEQFAFYQADGLRRFNASDPNKFLPSNVPEGSLIVRAHTPMSNLFSCLWFNEVERFTSRDQLSFYYTYQKLRRMNPGKPLYLNMFKDCERRAIAKLFHHRTEEKRNIINKKATG